jgi:lipopolysaccharide/colanic/teichoic acid biosynthesis glycosyltransferase
VGYATLKRALDITGSLILMPILGAVTVLVWIMIRRDDGGPVFYVSRRLGQNGRTFQMIKYRSMMVQAPDLRNPDGSTYNADDDPRLTRLGRILRKTSLDELPQIMNVLKGDMSFIGPRPDLPGALSRYSETERKKLQVRPGISGYSQAYYRNAADMAEKFKGDVYYVDHMSLSLDIAIFIKTLDTVFRRRNVYQGSSGQDVK